MLLNDSLTHIAAFQFKQRNIPTYQNSINTTHVYFPTSFDSCNIKSRLTLSSQHRHPFGSLGSPSMIAHMFQFSRLRTHFRQQWLDPHSQSSTLKRQCEYSYSQRLPRFYFANYLFTARAVRWVSLSEHRLDLACPTTRQARLSSSRPQI